MSSPDRRGAFWPTPQQELLLRAALLQGEPALQAWQEWKASVDLDDIDPGSLRLLPLLHRNLSEIGVEDAQMGRFRGIHRLTWYRNHTMFRDMAAVVSALQGIGLPTVILKGAALAVLHYRDHGLRPVGDVDVLVPTKDVSAALDLLLSLGWSSKKLKSSARLTETYLAQGHGVIVKDSAGQKLDLHWHALIDSGGANADEEFWEGAVEFELENVPTHALNPTDQLLHVCAHGARWSNPPVIQWPADAMVVIRTAEPGIDWARLLRLVEKHRLVVPLLDTLSYLRDVMEAPIPTEVLQTLQAMPVTDLERREYETRASPWQARGPLGELRSKYLRYSFLMRVAGLPPRLLGFPRFLMNTWSLEHWWQLPLTVLRRTAFRIGEMSDWYADEA